MPDVGVHAVGYIRARPALLCALVNSAQDHYRFAVGNVMDAGEPDVRPYGYTDARFERLVAPHRDDHDCAILLTSVPIEDNYFTRTLDLDVIIATEHQLASMVLEAKRTYEEAAAITACQELSSFEWQRVTGKSWKDLFHGDPRGCIFDFAGEKVQKVAKLREADICPDCRGKIASANMNNRVVEAVDAILRRIRRPSFRQALKTTTLSAGFGFVYGGMVLGCLVNVFSSLVLATRPLTTSQWTVLWVLIGATILMPLGVFGWQWLRYFRTRIR